MKITRVRKIGFFTRNTPLREFYLYFIISNEKNNIFF